MTTSCHLSFHDYLSTVTSLMHLEVPVLISSYKNFTAGHRSRKCIKPINFPPYLCIGTVTVRELKQYQYCYYCTVVTVPDRRRRIIPEVVLVRRGQLGFWEFGRGRVWVEGWDRGGQFTSNLRPRWTDPVTARRVPSK
jgi:hypothetical protein